ANAARLGGGGVDDAIVPVAGQQRLEECRLLHGCQIGDAKLTKGYRLPARFVIHTVGPVWRDGATGEPALLASCYRRSIEVAAANGILTLAFPSISTGVFGYPIQHATRVAVTTGRSAVPAFPPVQEVVFCCFSASDLAVYTRRLGEVGS